MNSDGQPGQEFPGPSLPFGMLQWSPDTNTDNDPTASYEYSPESTVVGFSLLHNSGLQYRYVPFLPLSVPVTTSPAVDPARYYGRFAAADEQASPGSYRVRLASGISVALTATRRAGLAQFTFPGSGTHTLMLALSDTGRAGYSAMAVQPGSASVNGYVTVNGTRLYFVVRFTQPIATFGTYSGAHVRPGQATVAGVAVGGWVGFAGSDRMVQAEAAVSYVSVAGAEANLVAEVVSPRLTFDRAVTQARSVWAALLGRFAVSSAPATELRTFYSALYGTLQQPNLASDVTGLYMGWDGRPHLAPAGHEVYTNISSWDMGRSQLAFLAVFFPNETADMMQSLVYAYEQSGGWASRLVTGTQVEAANTGDWALPAMAYLLGVRGFDADEALRIEVHTATVAAGNPIRSGLAFYEQSGWVPATVLFSAEDTIEYSYSDFIVSRFALALGQSQVSSVLAARAGNWQEVFDRSLESGTQHGFVWSRQANGTFSPGWDPAGGGCYGPFEEGSSAQYSFAALQDLAEVGADMGGPTAARRRLDSLLGDLNSGCLTSTAWLGNEPSLALPWLYDWFGSPSDTQAAARRVTTDLYSATPGGLPGNDDWGAMTTYYLWCALGMYPVLPGIPGVALASPSLGDVSITMENGSTLRISGGHGGTGDVFVTGLTVDGKPYQSPWLPLADVVDGGTLSFAVGTRPTTWGTDPPASAAPPSFG